jgi:hypothetical protein
MTEIRYPFSALIWDYVRGVLGTALGLGILFVNEWDNQLVWLFVGLTILFAIYTMATLKKQMTRFRISEEGVRGGWWSMRGVAWNELREISLRYYPTSRNRKRGWMTLTLKSAKDRIDIDSALPGFAALARRAGHEARRKGIALDRVSSENFAALEQKSPEGSIDQE